MRTPVEAIKDLANSLLSAHKIQAIGAVILAGAAIGCGEKNTNAQDTLTVPNPPQLTEPEKGAEVDESRVIDLPNYEQTTRSYYGPVKKGPFKEADIYVIAAEQQNQIDENYQKYGCTDTDPHPIVTRGVVAYAEAHGYTREVPLSYSPGDEFLHGDTFDIPRGVDVRKKVFAFFNGERYALRGEKKDVGDGDVRFEVPAEVGTPPYPYSPCNEYTDPHPIVTGRQAEPDTHTDPHPIVVGR